MILLLTFTFVITLSRFATQIISFANSSPEQITAQHVNIRRKVFLQFMSNTDPSIILLVGFSHFVADESVFSIFVSLKHISGKKEK